ncbi:MAG: hypothetical protein COT74_12680 [Bdellovibrionales bacterium CG10_big_fil_rev_8_21_14_0_10_45_34]|nr:MAG: hypothetical protein COT74_12680 [Bdellovibrionales bacterium CG10_big_fil_rev_8_21_14_0_10_45_34]
MAGHNRHGELSKEMKTNYPQVYLDLDSEFASIKIAKGTEAKSYIKDGFIFCEDSQGRIIEVQILNLSDLKAGKKPKRTA